MDQKEDVERLSEATSVIPDVSMLPRNGEHMQWWPIPSTRSAQVRLHSEVHVMAMVQILCVSLSLSLFFLFLGM